MYRSSLTLAFVVLYSAAAAASDIYVAPGAIYAPSADVYVRPAPAYRQQPYAEARLRISAAFLVMGRRPCLSCTGIGLWRVRTGLRPAAGLCRTRARLSRALLRAGASLRSRSLLRSGSLLRRGTRLCAGIRAEAAFARALPFARAMRRRLWQVGLLRLKPRYGNSALNLRYASGLRWDQARERQQFVK